MVVDVLDVWRTRTGEEASVGGCLGVPQRDEKLDGFQPMIKLMISPMVSPITNPGVKDHDVSLMLYEDDECENFADNS